MHDNEKTPESRESNTTRPLTGSGGKPLDYKPHEQFARMIAEGSRLGEAYATCVASPNAKRKGLPSRGGLLAKRPLVARRIAYLRERLAQQSGDGLSDETGLPDRMTSLRQFAHWMVDRSLPPQSRVNAGLQYCKLRGWTDQAITQGEERRRTPEPTALADFIVRCRESGADPMSESLRESALDPLLCPLCLQRKPVTPSGRLAQHLQPPISPTGTATMPGNAGQGGGAIGAI